MIVSPTPLRPSSVSTTTRAAVRSKRSPGSQKGSPVHGAVTSTVRTLVTLIARRSAGGDDDEVARHHRGVRDPAHRGVFGELVAEGIEDPRDTIRATERHSPQDRAGDE